MASETPLFTTAILTREIEVHSVEMYRITKANVDKTLKDLFRTKLNNLMDSRCIEDGYVMHDSIVVKGFSCGLIDADKIRYSVLFECQICLPTTETVIDCVVKSVSNGGIRAVLADIDPSPLVIFVAREIAETDLSAYGEGDVFRAKIFGVHFELNDKYISVLANIQE